MGWWHHLAPTEEPKCVAVGALQPQQDPPCCLHFALLYFLHFPFLLQVGQGSSPTKVIGRGGGGGRLVGTWDLGTSLDDPSLFLVERRPFSPFLRLMSISLSSSELGYTRAIMSLGEWVADCLSNSSLEFEILDYRICPFFLVVLEVKLVNLGLEE